MQIFYPEVCASNLGSFNELVVKQNFPSTESIHVFKKPISLTNGMYINIGMKKREILISKNLKHAETQFDS